jgi:hypothetical protein
MFVNILKKHNITNKIMKNLFTFIGLLTWAFLAAQETQKIRFDNDTAGNQIKRDFCLSCLSKTVNNTKEVNEITNSDLQKFSPDDNFSYYPNPLKENLFLKWELNNQNTISNIQIISLNGAIVKTINHLNTESSCVVSFLEYPSGVYILNLVYTSGEEKTIKIIKE